MIDWQKTASAVIGDVHRSLPSDADLETRKKALRAAKPYEFAVTSWGKKVWAKHQRAYLEKFGLPPLHAKKAQQHLSPLERLVAKARESAWRTSSSTSSARWRSSITSPGTAPTPNDQRGSDT